MDISNWIEKHADFSPEKAAVQFVRHSNSTEVEVWNYAEFEQRISKIASGLKQKFAVGAGDRVAFLGYNNPDLLALLFACARLGAILVPLNWRLAAA
ncbi:MAG: AMP-binding protein, partial [Candidatus Marinimicrobia bacterium]|nr:AMP-binding protein [Candidatus Neomarinimicrobiota bacterium]